MGMARTCSLSGCGALTLLSEFDRVVSRDLQVFHPRRIRGGIQAIPFGFVWKLTFVKRLYKNFLWDSISTSVRVSWREPDNSRCFSTAVQERCPPRQKSRVERLKAKVEPLITEVTVGSRGAEEHGALSE